MAKDMRIGLALMFCGLLTVVCDFGLAHGFAQASSNTPTVIALDKLRLHVVTLAADKYEGRGAGYKGERQAAEYIAHEFKKISLKPAGDSNRGRRSYFQEFKFNPMHPVVPWQVLTSRNILGLFEGEDPVLRNEIVVVAAHYDGQGRSGQADPTRFGIEQAKATNDEIWNSADDNAASVGAILEIARALKSGKVVMKRSILFIAFGAEEHGMSGSIHYVNHPVFPLSNHVAMINLEKLGRAPEKPFSINGSRSSPVWQEVVATAREQTKLNVVPNIPFNVPDSDHYPFNASRIPAVMIYVSGTTHAHFASDTADRIDFSRVAHAAQFAMAMVWDLAIRASRPKYAPSPMPDLGLIGHLATAAEADAKGLSAPGGGLKVTGVIPGLPAGYAGVQPGDFVTDFAGYQFRRDDKVSALMAVYREVLEGKRGNVLPLKIIRDKKRLDLTLMMRR
ncbi:MAG TPA: M20/M25/M40 family metallo-hydrolase [Pyrinomonadaceae bacterium]|nr:M20/M25/M40 family metallo-hydrolase [Pyrinomonadaceae bacterium]